MHVLKLAIRKTSAAFQVSRPKIKETRLQGLRKCERGKGFVVTGNQRAIILEVVTNWMQKEPRRKHICFTMNSTAFT